jgi:hypothetical protein
MHERRESGQTTSDIDKMLVHCDEFVDKMLSALAGWDALLETAVKRLRYSRCGERRRTIAVRAETKRDG